MPGGSSGVGLGVLTGAVMGLVSWAAPSTARGGGWVPSAVVSRVSGVGGGQDSRPTIQWGFRIPPGPGSLACIPVAAVPGEPETLQRDTHQPKPGSAVRQDAIGLPRLTAQPGPSLSWSLASGRMQGGTGRSVVSSTVIGDSLLSRRTGLPDQEPGRMMGRRGASLPARRQAVVAVSPPSAPRGRDSYEVPDLGVNELRGAARVLGRWRRDASAVERITVPSAECSAAEFKSVQGE